MTGQEIRVVVWGLGSHGTTRVVPAIEAAGSTVLAGVISSDEHKARALAAEHEVTAFTDPQKALESPDVDAVYLSTVTSTHASFGKQIVAAGKHLWSEKPIALSIDDLDELAELAAENHTAVFEVDMFLHHPQHQILRQLLAEGDVGPMRSITARFGFPHRPIDEFRYRAELGGGAMADAGFYPVAAAVDLMDDPLTIEAAVITRQDGFQVDTDGAALLTGGADVSAILEWGFGRAYRNEIEVWTREAVIRLSRAFAKPGNLATEVSVTRSDGSVTKLEAPPTDPFVAMLNVHGDLIASGRVGLDPAARRRTELLTRMREMPNHG